MDEILNSPLKMLCLSQLTMLKLISVPQCKSEVSSNLTEAWKLLVQERIKKAQTHDKFVENKLSEGDFVFL